MASRIRGSSRLWDLERYLTQRHKEIERKYEYHYSPLTDVLGEPFAENRLSEEELHNWGSRQGGNNPFSRQIF